MICLACREYQIPYELLQEVDFFDICCEFCGAENGMQFNEETQRKEVVENMVPSVHDLLENERTAMSPDIRKPQVEMARAIEDAIHLEKTIITEAGTGTGKTWAYLVPSMALGKRVIVATATKALQNQIIKPGGDGDMVTQKLAEMGYDRTVVALRGKGNYACLKRYEKLKKDDKVKSKADEKRVDEWFDRASKGHHYGEMRTLDNPPQWFDDVRVDQCAKSKCSSCQLCGYYRNVLDAKEANVVVANHDLVAIEHKISRMIPSAEGEEATPNNFLFGDRDAVIFDEAHQLEEAFERVWESSISELAIKRFCNDLEVKYPEGPAASDRVFKTEVFYKMDEEGSKIDLGSSCPMSCDCSSLYETGGWDPAAEKQLKTAFERLSRLGDYGSQGHVMLRDLSKELVQPILLNMYAALAYMQYNIQDYYNLVSAEVSSAYSMGNRSKADYDDLMSRYWDVKSDFQKLERWMNTVGSWVRASESYVHYMEKNKNQYGDDAYAMVRKPINLAMKIKSFWEENTCIFSSATMSDGGSTASFSMFQKRLGLELPADNCLSVDSPFNYKKQCWTYVTSEKKHAKPTRPSRGESYGDFLQRKETYFEDMTDEIAEWLSVTRGNTLILCASNEDLKEYHERLRTHSTVVKMALPFYTQLPGADPDRLIRDYKRTSENMARNNTERKGPVLMGVKSLWEGISIKSPWMNSVIVTRVPFPVPSDPIQKKRKAQIEEYGGNWFKELMLYPGSIAMRQGTGRLIRSKHDKGLVVCLDSRLKQKRWGQKMLQSMPTSKQVVYTQNKEKLIGFWRSKIGPYLQKFVDYWKENSQE